jgi:hypothetical protein
VLLQEQETKTTPPKEHNTSIPTNKHHPSMSQVGNGGGAFQPPTKTRSEPKTVLERKHSITGNTPPPKTAPKRNIETDEVFSKLSIAGVELNHGGAEGSAAHCTTTLLIYIPHRDFGFKEETGLNGSKI